jgi:predicted amidohydrolase
MSGSQTARSGNQRVSVFQTELPWHAVHVNLESFAAGIARLEDTDLIVLFEMFCAGFTMQENLVADRADGRTAEWLHRQASPANAALTASAVMAEDRRYFNPPVLIEPAGRAAIYDKRHLFRMAAEDEHQTALAAAGVSWRSWRVNGLICYDLRFRV